MAFRIEPANRPEDRVDFTIVTNDGIEHEVSFPKVDCLPPATVARLSEVIASIEDTDNIVDSLRAQLKGLAPEHSDLWDQLVQRQITDIFDHWNKESAGDADTGASDLGE